MNTVIYMKSELYKIEYDINKQVFFVTDKKGNRESDKHWETAVGAIEWAEAKFQGGLF